MPIFKELRCSDYFREGKAQELKSPSDCIHNKKACSESSSGLRLMAGPGFSSTSWPCSSEAQTPGHPSGRELVLILTLPTSTWVAWFVTPVCWLLLGETGENESRRRGLASCRASLMCGLQSNCSWKKHVSPAILLHLVNFQERLLKGSDLETCF